MRAVGLRPLIRCYVDGRATSTTYTYTEYNAGGGVRHCVRLCSHTVVMAAGLIAFNMCTDVTQFAFNKALRPPYRMHGLRVCVEHRMRIAEIRQLRHGATWHRPSHLSCMSPHARAVNVFWTLPQRPPAYTQSSIRQWMR